MAIRFEAPDFNTYRMKVDEPHVPLEPLEDEVKIVDEALSVLFVQGILPSTEYDKNAFLTFREAVKQNFEIPWTAITPRMQRLIWAINAITKPQNMIAAGIFCGNTFISNAGAAVGPGAVYTAQNLVGVEIVPAEAERAERNVRKIDPTGVARIVAEDAVKVVEEWPHEINVLYLDADGAGGKGKGIYLEILEAGLSKMPKGSVVMAHNSINSAEALKWYLEFVRDPAKMAASVNCALDGEGLEVSVV